MSFFATWGDAAFFWGFAAFAIALAFGGVVGARMLGREVESWRRARVAEMVMWLAIVVVVGSLATVLIVVGIDVVGCPANAGECLF